jgi:periplasmic protein TonB
MRLIFAAFFSLTFMHSKAQDTTKPNRDTATLFSKVEIEAEFPGGKSAWLRFLNKNLRYPNDAVSNNIQGDIAVQFVVDSQGKVSDIHAVSGPRNGGLREEAERLIRKSGLWNPAILNGMQVKSWKTRIISFKLVQG